MLTFVNGALEEAFRAHSWATRRLLEFCQKLTPEQLAAGRNDATGWSVLETFSHLVSADGYYVGSLDGSGRPCRGGTSLRSPPGAWTPWSSARPGWPACGRRTS